MPTSTAYLYFTATRGRGLTLRSVNTLPVLLLARFLSHLQRESQGHHRAIKTEILWKIRKNARSALLCSWNHTPGAFKRICLQRYRGRGVVVKAIGLLVAEPHAFFPASLAVDATASQAL